MRASNKHCHSAAIIAATNTAPIDTQDTMAAPKSGNKAAGEDMALK